MKTIILPGYSPHNKDWAEDIKAQMDLEHEVIVHNWKHWTSGSFLLKYELEGIIKEVGSEKVNILAKSVGVHVAMNLILKIPSQVNKVIFCGIASIEGDERRSLLQAVLSKIQPDHILCIQNEKDKFVVFEDAEAFYHSVEPRLKVISKPRSDHEYPYPEDFRKFLE